MVPVPVTFEVVIQIDPPAPPRSPPSLKPFERIRPSTMTVPDLIRPPGGRFLPRHPVGLRAP
jgi:hypothetical protein